jgi:chaperone modulatory protein CbpM
MDKMKKEIVLTGIIVDDDSTVTLTKLRQRFGIDDEILQDMIEYGLIETFKNTSNTEEYINIHSLNRIQSALHLYEDLEINMAGAAVVLDLLEQLNAREQELVILRKLIAKS